MMKERKKQRERKRYKKKGNLKKYCTNAINLWYTRRAERRIRFFLKNIRDNFLFPEKIGKYIGRKSLKLFFLEKNKGVIQMFKNKKIVALLLLAVMLMLPLANALAIEVEIEPEKEPEKQEEKTPAPKTPGPARVPEGCLEDIIVGVPEMKVLPRAGACR